MTKKETRTFIAAQVLAGIAGQYSNASLDIAATDAVRAADLLLERMGMTYEQAIRSLASGNSLLLPFLQKFRRHKT